MNAVNARLNKILLRREFWENRALWIGPLATVIICGVLCLILVIKVIAAHYAGGAVEGGFNFNGVPDLSTVDQDKIAGVLRVMPLMLAIPFTVVMQIIVFFYFLDSLYADRRDRSMLFWQSMPISDARSVLSKLATGLIATVVITLLATIAFQLILIVLEMILGAAFGAPVWLVLTHPLAVLSGWLLLAYGLIVAALWFLPLYGWVMLASGWARKNPFLWAILPPLAIMLVEFTLFQSGHFAHLVFGRFREWIPLAFNIGHSDMEQGKDFILNTDLVDADSVVRFIGSPGLWIGAAIAAGFIYGAIWLRRNRAEI